MIQSSAQICFILTILADLVSSERVIMHAPNEADLNSKRQTKFQVPAGTFVSNSNCYLSSVTCNGIQFPVNIDTTRGDLLLPAEGINAYFGPAVNAVSTTSPLGETLASGVFWKGFLKRLPVTIGSSTNLTVLNALNAPVILISSQNEATSDATTFLGVKGYGYQGFAFPLLSNAYGSAPQTVLEAFVQHAGLQGQLSQVTFSFCDPTVISVSI